jgi:sugar phosphate permease
MVVSRRGTSAHGVRSVVGGLVLAGVAMLILGLLPPLLHSLHLDGTLVPLAVLLAVLFGAGLGAVLIPCLVLIQEGTEESTRGRIFGGAFLVINLAIALPLLVAGAIADVIGASDVIAFMGLCLAVTGLVAGTRAWGRGPGRGASGPVTNP